MSVQRDEFKCSKGEPCHGLSTHHLHNEANAHKKGLSLLIVTNTETWKKTVAGVVSKKSSRDRGVVLNFCPSCGESLESWLEDVTDKASPAPSAEAS